MSFEGKYKAVKRKIKSVGISATIKLIIEHVINRIYYREGLLFYVDLPNYSVDPKQINPDITGKKIRNVDELSQNDIIEIKDYAGENCIKEFERRFNNNWRLFLAYMGNHVAGACWVFDNNSEFKTKIVPLFDGDIALSDAWTIPSFRGKNVLSFLFSFMANEFKVDNSGRVFGDTKERNIASIKSYRKAAYRHLINYEAYRLFSYEIVIWKPISDSKKVRLDNGI